MDLNAVAVDHFVNTLFAGGHRRLTEVVAAARSVRRQIVVAAEGLLDIYRCSSRRIWIGSASRYHAHRPVTFCTVIGDAIYCDAGYTRTAGSLSNFFQCPPPQSLHRK